MGNQSSSSSEIHDVEVHDVVAWKLEMIAVDGRFRGMRGATYNAAVASSGYRIRTPDEEENPGPIRYGDASKGERECDIYMDIFFLDHSDVATFQRRVHEVHTVHDLVSRDYQPSFTSTLKRFKMRLGRLVAMGTGDFSNFTPARSIDFDQASQSLSAFSSSERSRKRSRDATPRSSGRISTRSSGNLSVVDKCDPLFIWQQLESPGSYYGDPYRLHLQAKKDNPAENINNYVAGSWEFHQLLDGLNNKSYGGVPGMTIEYEKADGTWVQADDGRRYKVYVRLRFLNPKDKEGFLLNVADRMKTDEDGGWKEDGSFESFVHVLNVGDFHHSLDLKLVQTKKERREAGFE